MVVVLAITAEERAQLKAVSRVLFGQEQRLLVILAIAAWGKKPFTLTDLKRELSLEYASALQRPLADLVAAGYVRPEPPIAASRFRPYSRVESLLWGLGEEVLAGIRARAEPIADDRASVTPLARRRRDS
jgi:DNA-binding IclR family transcriptional regulator